MCVTQKVGAKGLRGLNGPEAGPVHIAGQDCAFGLDQGIGNGVGYGRRPEASRHLHRFRDNGGGNTGAGSVVDSDHRKIRAGGEAVSHGFLTGAATGDYLPKFPAAVPLPYLRKPE